ncbi:palmitoyl-protein thioesterase 1-like [Impatiens glandulifera]|uniref:palmitoyl-protein thioesterase 1-like n=1 Tax=Impatiens glandulifera TaxID=253017 RepID=UPI001FB11D65|nr:palmitoyl-protein thioesterase 1-like [Impatiens glandulifera]
MMTKIVLIVFALSWILTSTYSLPFVVFHGIADKCSNKGLKRFTNLLSEMSGSEGHCIEIGNGAWDSWLMPFEKQATLACEKVKNISALSEGYNIVGLSQGNIIGRAVIELCEESPQVNNFISLGGPHAGIASIPLCGSGVFCVWVDYLVKLEVYSDYVQEHLAPSGYIKIPTDIDSYMKGCKFLPKLNNEYKDHKNASYKARFASLQNLVLIMFEEDKVLVPKETSLFGFFPDGSWTDVLPAQETALYKEDWIGLRTLDEAGKVKFLNISGGHLEITTSDMQKLIVPYLEETNTSSAADYYYDKWSIRKLVGGIKEETLYLHSIASA